MIVQRTEPALGVGRRLRILPQPSYPRGDGFTYCKDSRSKTSTNNIAMHIKCNQLRDYDAFTECIKPSSNYSPKAYSRSISQRISINYDALTEWESSPFPRRYPNSIHQPFSTGSPPGPPKCFSHIHFHKPRIVPSLIRLADDLTGMEAGWETKIGDKNNVTKHIN